MGTRVFRVTTDGDVSVFAEGFTGASGNTFDTAGRLIQSNVAGNTISDGPAHQARCRCRMIWPSAPMAGRSIPTQSWYMVAYLICATVN